MADNLLRAMYFLLLVFEGIQDIVYHKYTFVRVEQVISHHLYNAAKFDLIDKKPVTLFYIFHAFFPFPSFWLPFIDFLLF